MRLIKYRPKDSWGALESLQEEINRLFELPFGRLPALSEESLAPSVDIWEDKDNLYVEADIPGVDQKDIKLTLKDDHLVIFGKKESNKEEKRKGVFRSERFQGSFYRAIGLTSAVENAKIKAQYKNGVLKVTLPKKEDTKEKEIQIDV